MSDRVRPTLGRVVIYRSRTGNYDVPAMVTCTPETLAPVGLELWHSSGGEKGVPPITEDQRDRVHLAVFTPGIPGMRVTADDFVGERKDAPISENVAGTYQEWDVPYDSGGATPDTPLPGTWRWPTRV